MHYSVKLLSLAIPITLAMLAGRSSASTQNIREQIDVTRPFCTDSSSEHPDSGYPEPVSRSNQKGAGESDINIDDEIDAFLRIGLLFTSRAQYNEALGCLQQVFKLYQATKSRRGQGRTLFNIAWVYYLTADYQQSIENYQKALDIQSVIQDRGLWGETYSLGGLGLVYYALGDYQRAITYAEKALEIADSTGDSIALAYSLVDLGDYYNALGQHARSLNFYEQAIEVGVTWYEPYPYIGAGNALYSLEQYSQALSYYQQALEISGSNRHPTVYARLGLGQTYQAIGDYSKALEQYQQAAKTARALGIREGESAAFSQMGRLYADQEKFELAIVFLKASIEVSESIRNNIQGLDRTLQKSYLSTVDDNYRFLADLLLQQNRILEAQRVLDLLKVQELDDALRGVRSSDTSGVTFWQVEKDLLTLYEQVITDSEELAQLQAQEYDSLSPEQQQRLYTLRQRYTDLQNRFTAFLDLPEVSTLLAQISQQTERQNLDIETQHRTLQNNLRALPQKTALLYPLILSDRLELVLITADGPPLRYPIAVTGVELNRAIVAFGQALKSPGSDIQPLAQELHTWLVDPLEPQLTQAGIESILYAPDGALRYVPLAALHDGERYLAERFSISHITAASLTDFDAVPQADSRRLLAAACAECSFTVTVGDLTFPFGDLPYTETEVESVAEQVPNARVLLNQEFSRSELETRLGSYSIIHLATHGAMVENQPNQSFLVLGSGETVSRPLAH